MKTMVERLKDGGGEPYRWYEAFPLRRLAESAAEVDVYSPVASSIAKISPRSRETAKNSSRRLIVVVSFSPPRRAALSSLKKSKSTLELNLFLATRAQRRRFILSALPSCVSLLPSSREKHRGRESSLCSSEL